MTDPIRIQIDDRAAQAALDRAAGVLGELTPIMRAITGVLADASERAFAAEADPATGTPWVDLAPSTRQARAKRGKWPGQKLQLSGQLAASVTTDFGRDYALIGSNKAYAAIHYFGGTIERAPYSTWVDLRTDAAGALLRQGTEGRKRNLAVFAAADHAQKVRKRVTVQAYSISIPARRYLGLGPDDGDDILDIVERHLAAALK